MYLIATVPEDITKKLDEIINKKHTEKANHDLAGNIQNEFLIPDGKPVVWPLINQCIQAHFDKFPSYFSRISGMHNTEHFSLELHNLWVNYQKNMNLILFTYMMVCSVLLYGTKFPIKWKMKKLDFLT